MTAPKRPRTLGDMISTVCFAGVAMWLYGEAAIRHTEAGGWQVWGLVASASACLLGALRHVIADLWERLFGADKA